jgi:hypothetical protein
MVGGPLVGMKIMMCRQSSPLARPLGRCLSGSLILAELMFLPDTAVRSERTEHPTPGASPPPPRWANLSRKASPHVCRAHSSASYRLFPCISI